MATFYSDARSVGLGRLYLNSIAIANGATAVPEIITRVNNFLGRSNWTVDDYYDGRMDDVRIYSRAFVPAAIKALALGSGTNDMDPSTTLLAAILATADNATGPLATRNTIDVWFSKAVTLPSATNPANYSLSIPGLSITNAACKTVHCAWFWESPAQCLPMRFWASTAWKNSTVTRRRARYRSAWLFPAL